MLEDLVQVLLGGGGTQGGDGIGDPGLMQAHHVHVALDDHQALEVGMRLPRFVQAVQLAALVKQRRFGRVEVFRFALVEHATAEADHPSRASRGWETSAGHGSDRRSRRSVRRRECRAR